MTAFSKNRLIWIIGVVCLCAPTDLAAQQQAAAAHRTINEAATLELKTAGEKRGEHRFWDRSNDWLFAGVAASRTLDYFSTLNMRRRGRQEILLTNDLVDNHGAFAAIEAGGTGVTIGASYLFHRFGHHKLERWTSIVHIGLATSGAIRNYSLQTARQAPAPVR